MAWYRNHYDCDRCGGSWTDEWSATCDDDCPHCGARHMSPTESDDLTAIVEYQPRLRSYVVLRSARTADYYPHYWRAGTFVTAVAATAAARQP
jgi:hypothetical protein